jgi:hypothetical protein
MYGSIWQYQAWAGPVGAEPAVEVVRQPESVEPFLELLPDEILGSFDSPLADAEITGRPWATEPFLEELPVVESGEFVRPVDVSDEYAAWHQSESVGLPPQTDPLDEQWFSFVARDEEPFSLSWYAPETAFDYTTAEAFDGSVAPFAESGAPPVFDFAWFAPQDYLLEIPPEVDGWFDRPLDVSDEYSAWHQSESVGLGLPPDEILGWFDRSLDVVDGYAPWHQSESVGLPPEPTPLDEQWLSFVARDEGPQSLSWLTFEEFVHDVPAVPLDGAVWTFPPPPPDIGELEWYAPEEFVHEAPAMPFDGTVCVFTTPVVTEIGWFVHVDPLAYPPDAIDELWFITGESLNPAYGSVQGKLWRYLTNQWGSVYKFRLSASMLATSGVVYAQLYDLTAAAAVSSTQIHTTSATITEVLSGTFTPVNNHLYGVRFGKIGADAGEGYGADVIGRAY